MNPQHRSAGTRNIHGKEAARWQFDIRFQSSSARPAWRLAVLLALAVAALAFYPPSILANSPPATPASVSVIIHGNNNVLVSWDAPAGATKYHITYSTDGGNSWSVVVGPNPGHNETSFQRIIDGSLTYIFGVRAGNAHGWSGWRNSAPFGPAAPPATPASVSVSRANGTLTASWNSVISADIYHITYSSNGGGSWTAASDNHPADRHHHQRRG